MNRIDATFKGLESSGRKAFIAYLTAGYPSLSATEELILALSGTVDIIELGVPFSDPVADGPVIQEASLAALAAGTSLERILSMVRRVRARTRTPLCLMTYYNPVFCYGHARFIRDASAAGVDGLIVPDLPPEEGAGLRRGLAREGIHMVLFVAPTTPPERMRLVARQAGGFIYYICLTGVTGAREALDTGSMRRIAVLKRFTRVPVCAGFGISTPAQAVQAGQYADGVIVGSAIIKVIREHIGRPDMARAVTRFCARLAGKDKTAR